MCKHQLKIKFIIVLAFVTTTVTHDAKDFDDSILYKIDFEIPDSVHEPAFNNQLVTFYTHEKEKYECIIPRLEERKEEVKENLPELSPIALIQPIFSAPTCSYRVEAYWSYEICHGRFVRQYHEEREGKNVKFQEYYLGKWNKEKTEQILKTWEDDRKTNNKMKYRTIKIDNTKYPYFEMEFTDGTLCDIINSPRTTNVRYVCHPLGKNEIYSFKETSSCNYEAVILTSLLCVMPEFHHEESKEVSIKCFNSPTESRKPLSMLRQELGELQLDEDFPISKEAKTAASLWSKPDTAAEQDSGQIGGDVEKLILELLTSGTIDLNTNIRFRIGSETPSTPVRYMTPLLDLMPGNCLTGGSGWWKYEYCYGRHVRQYHKDKHSDTELYLGYFNEERHRQWVDANPGKGARRAGFKSTVWHHYDKGSHCDKTGLPRQVDVKLTCTTGSSSTSVSMYLLEPKTCQYILVVEAPIVCGIVQHGDEYGLIEKEQLQKILRDENNAATATNTNAEPKKTETKEEIRS